MWVDGNVRFGKETVEGLRLAAAAERPMTRADWLREAAESETLDVLGATSKAGAKYFNSMRDRDGYRAFAEAVQKRGAELRAQEGSAPDASADQGQANG